MDFVPILVLIAVVKKTVDFIKDSLPANLQNRLVQAIAVVVGIGYSFLFSVSAIGGAITVGNTTLGNLDPASVVIFGIALATGAGLANDAIERANPDKDPDTPAR